MIWDEREFVLRNADLHHNVDYTPYEGQTLRAWPGVTIARGEVVWDGQFHPRAAAGGSCPAGRLRCCRGAPTSGGDKMTPQPIIEAERIELARLIRSGEVGAVEVFEAVCARSRR